MTPLLSILIPSLPLRDKYLRRLLDQLDGQVNGHAVEVLTDLDTTMQIGQKRNVMLARAKGDYIAFIDDDDRISENYISLIMEGLTKSPDCCSLNGIITTDGVNPKPFRHSMDYTSLYEEDGVYFRPINHLNCVRTEIARQIGFPDWKYSEDTNYAIRLAASGLLKTEYKISDNLYYYDYISDKRRFDYTK